MNAIAKITSQSMTSLEIAKLVEKRPDNVKRTIETLAEKAIIQLPQIEDCGRINGLGIKQSFKVYVFSGEQGKRDSIIVVAQLCPEFTARLVDRWQELEAQVAQPVIPQTYAEALQLAADQARQLELAAPKIKHYDAVVEKSVLLNATQVAQKVGWSAKKLNNVLDGFNVYNKAISRGRAFKQWFVDQHFGIMRQTDAGHAQPMFTMKGESWIVERLISEGFVDPTALAKHLGS